MSEANLIKELEQISKTERPTPVAGAKTVYAAQGWFSPRQEELIKITYANMLKNETLAHIHLPLLNQADGFNPLVEDDSVVKPDMREWALDTFANDVSGMDNSDIIIAVLEAGNVDEGTVGEIFYMYANHKPVVVVYDGDSFKHPLNLMPAMATTRFISIDEIATYDFRTIMKNKYVGEYI